MDVLRYIINHIWTPREIKKIVPARAFVDELYSTGSGTSQDDGTTF